MDTQCFVDKLQRSEEFFMRSTSTLTEDDAAFAPGEGLYNSAQMMAHVAQTIDWFFEGAFRPEGFDLNFEKHVQRALEVQTLKEAREWIQRSFRQAREAIGSKSMDDLMMPLPAGPVMGGAPRVAIIDAIAEHTAHHRGALGVYARLRGHQPPMPYGEM